MKAAGTLPPPSKEDDPLPPLKTFHIPKGALDDLPFMVQPKNMGEGAAAPADGRSGVNQCKDPVSGLP